MRLPGSGRGALMHRTFLRRASVHRRLALFAAVVLTVGLISAVQIAAPSRAAAATAVLLSQNQPVTASSVRNADDPAAAVVDGNPGTGWSSSAVGGASQWLAVDLGEASNITSVELQWAAAYATAFRIQTSDDDSAWTTIYSTTVGTGGTQVLEVTGTGRYVRVYATAGATRDGYSLSEFKVYGTNSVETVCGTADVALNRPVTASSQRSAAYPPSAATAGDSGDSGDSGSAWSSAALGGPQWLTVNLGADQQICAVGLDWGAAYATAYRIQVSTDDAHWATIYSTTASTGGDQSLRVSGSGEYLRMYATAGADPAGYSLAGLHVYATTDGSTLSDAAAKPAASGSTTYCGMADEALNQPTTASSDQTTAYTPGAATDGNLGTRWSSAASDPQWLEVDLGSTQSICGVTLDWEAAYASGFQIQTSTDNVNWTTIYSTTTGTGGDQALSVTGTGRYIRMYGTVRATQYGYSLWEFIVYTTTSTPPISGGTGSGGDGVCPWVGSTLPVAQRVQEVLNNITQAQEISMLAGNGDSSPYIGDTTGIPALCIPNMGYQDGPSGVGDGLGGVTQFPDGESTAATFDPSLAEQQGAAEGAEFAAKGVNVALGPTANIVRDPRWGRAFETYGEDPYLSGQIASADIQGLQSQGVMAMVKHASVYTQETNRNSGDDNAIVSQQAIQEIYEAPFQTAVDQGGAASVMCAYSTVNGVYSCQNPDTLQEGLYQQANFGGFVASDWGATHSTVPSLQAGMDMEMPGAYFYSSSSLTPDISSGIVQPDQINQMAAQILTEMFSFGLFDKPASGSSTATVATAAHQATAEQVAQEGTVLLKNNGVLPLNPTGSESIAVIGVDGQASGQDTGGGSATVTSSGTVWPITGIQNAAGPNVKVTYSPGDDNGTADIPAAVTAAQNANVAIVFASYPEQEGTDLTSIDLSSTDNTMIEDVAAANPHTIVVLNTGSAVTMPWLSSVAGVFDGFYPGQEFGTAIASLIFGTANPSGKLPVTFPVSLSQVPATTAAEWPGTNDEVLYNEGVDVGYRWYQSQNITPLFMFGYGLSYTTFSFSNLNIGAINANGTATVTATMTNTGSRAGADVAQLYVGDPASSGDPPQQLKGFDRVTLQPGQSQTVQFSLTAHDLASWSGSAGAWQAAAGSYKISVGDAPTNLPLSGTVTLGQTLTGSVAAGSSAAGTSAANTAVSANVTPNSTQPGAGTVGVVNPWGMSSPVGSSVDFAVQAQDSNSAQSLTFTATGLPAGITISSAGVITGSATTQGGTTVTVTATDGNGVSGSATFVWTTTPSVGGGGTPPPPPPPSTEAPYGGTAAVVPGTVQAENYDTGGQGVAYSVTAVNGTGNSYRSDGVDLEATTDTGGGYDLGWTTAGQWFRYTVNVATAGTYTVSLRVAAASAVTDALHIDNSAGTNLSGSVNVPATGGWQTWTTVTATVTLPAGQQTLTVDQDNPGWNINYLSFAATGSSSSAWYEVVNENSGLCASAAGAGTANGTAVEQLACTGATSQLWQLVPVATGYDEVLNDNAQSEGESWNITGGVSVTASGDLLQTWNYGGTTNTNALFAANLGSTGYYTFVADNSGLCIDTPGASTASGVQLQQYTCNGTPAQAFKLVQE
jgi:beta-glucosidase